MSGFILVACVGIYYSCYFSAASGHNISAGEQVDEPVMNRLLSVVFLIVMPVNFKMNVTALYVVTPALHVYIAL